MSSKARVAPSNASHRAALAKGASLVSSSNPGGGGKPRNRCSYKHFVIQTGEADPRVPAPPFANYVKF